ncbi:MAG: alpha-amylase family glycosyl hydrolase [Ignavibacteria bacterium]|jgi:hypothetical protein
MKFNPSIYEINTRVWLNRFNSENKKATLDDVPLTYWDELREKGIDYVWLMGVWKTNQTAIEKYCFEEGLVKSYSKALRDWKKEDVIGSPYSIDIYDVNPRVGSLKSIHRLRKELNKRNVKLILDFVPNHFSAESSLVKTKPDLFLKVNRERFEEDNHTYFKPDENVENYFAHGRDPFFPAWQDTIQVNYFSIPAREFMIKMLINLTKFCDGVRCDMAMLSLNNVFRNTWGNVAEQNSAGIIKDEFWKTAIEILKNVCPQFIFLAEAYWGLEWELQQQGFDFTYDKKLTDRLKSGPVPDINDHFQAAEEYQEKSIRFIENHDEERAVAKLGVEKSLAAAVIISTVKGMRFYCDGQFEGKKIRLPVQLGSEPNEKTNGYVQSFYNRLLRIANRDIFKKGEWQLIEPLPASDNNDSYINILCWKWSYENENRLVVVNYSGTLSMCRIKFELKGFPEKINLYDELNDENYPRSTNEINTKGLYIELKNYRCHIFAY